MVCNALPEHAIVLATWWAIWTLADRYLISFTPYAELVVLAGAAATWVVRTQWAAFLSGCTAVLSSATQTPAPPSAKAARAYARQSEQP
jgi:hypothetical protein